jgi:hypothetical protein
MPAPRPIRRCPLSAPNWIRHRRHGWPASSAVVAVLVGAALAGCSHGPSASKITVPTTSSSTTTTSTVPPTTTTTTEQPGWTPVSTVNRHIAVDQISVAQANGDAVTVVRFRAGRVKFNLHVGSTDPPTGGATVGPDAGPAIGPDETPLLLAAFNGGFLTGAGAGGFELNSQPILSLVPGRATLLIDAGGAAHVGAWTQGIPAPGEVWVSARQNLNLLVSGGQPSGQISSIGAWGATLGGGAAVARSSVGEDASGNILYAAGMSVLPSDLANALIASGAVNAMELDINPEWVQLSYAALPGLALATAIPGQNRPATQYQSGWTRDFVTVLSTG